MATRRQHHLTALAAFLVVTAACGGSGAPGSSESRPGPSRPETSVSVPPRAIRVSADRVVIEGRWHPVESAGPPVVPNVVKVVCVRAERRCQENLMTAPPGRPAVNEVLEYRVKEWTNAKLVAVRRTGRTEVRLQVALTGLAAEKIVQEGKSARDGGVRLRLE